MNFLKNLKRNIGLFFKEMRCSKEYFNILYGPKVWVTTTQEKTPFDLRMYVIINRPILTLVQAGVQGAHAIHTYCYEHADNMHYKNWQEKHKTLIFLEASAAEILEIQKKLEKNGKTASVFQEPDMDLALTAIACEPMTSTEGAVFFQGLKLLK